MSAPTYWTSLNRDLTAGIFLFLDRRLVNLPKLRASPPPEVFEECGHPHPNFLRGNLDISK